MKELKNRIKGLSAILLAVSLTLCLVMRFSGVKASAAIQKMDTLTIASSTTNGNYSADDAMNQIFAKILSVTGGTFSISGDVSGKIKCYGSDGSEVTEVTAGSILSRAEINTESGFTHFMITGSNKQTMFGNTTYTFTLQFVNAPDNEGTLDAGTYYLFADYNYKFSDSGSSYMVQGDPTVYKTELPFVVGSDGNQTILKK